MLHWEDGERGDGTGGLAVAVIGGWTSEHDRAFKELLYRFLEEVHCTKAALYLLAPDGSYALTTQYGFGRRDRIAVAHGPGDPYLNLLREVRSTPRAFNHPSEVADVASYLEAAGTARLLLVPLAADSRVLGFVDARDKGRRRPFEDEDLRRAAVIARALVSMLGRSGLYPELEADAELSPPTTYLEPSGELPVTLDDEPALDEPALAELFEAVVRAAVSEDMTAALTVVDSGAAATRVVAVGDFPEGDRLALLRHQAQILHRADVMAGEPSSWRVDLRVVAEASAAEREREVHTAVLLKVADWSVTASVVGPSGGRAASVLEGLGAVADAAHRAAGLRWARRRLARRLLSPGERRNPRLEAHSVAVSRLSWTLAHLLGWDGAEAESAALAGLLHDVGIRELGDEAETTRAVLSAEVRRMYQRHPALGEKIVAGCGLDELVPAIRHHHERWDGNGYPDRLSGEGIPALARLVHVAEVWDVLTASHSYRRTVPAERAVAILRAASGHQFDPRMVDALERAVS